MKRVLTGLILLPLVSYVVLWSSPWVFLAVLTLVAVICYHEYSQIVASMGFRMPAPLGYATGLLVLLTNWNGVLVLTLAALLFLALSMRAADLTQVGPQTGLLLFGLVYIFGCWRSAIGLREASPYWLFYGLAISWVGDVGAYYVGRRFGRHRLSPRVSPGKTWEGAIASVAASVAFGVIFLRFLIPAVPLWQSAALSVAANAAGQIGDLAESALKRGACVKDSGWMLPGHGGMLDRVDSTLFALPLVLLYVQFGTIGS